MERSPRPVALPTQDRRLIEQTITCRAPDDPGISQAGNAKVACALRGAWVTSRPSPSVHTNAHVKLRAIERRSDGRRAIPGNRMNYSRVVAALKAGPMLC